MKSILIVFIILLHTLSGQNLKICYGDRLYYQNGENIYKIKQLKNSSIFQGYDIIDSMHVFFTYQGEGAEASTNIVVFDISTGTEIFIKELGSTGESFFQYNKDNDLVLFNWYDGLYTFKLHDSENKFILKPKLKLILKCKECYLPFWVNSKIIGYLSIENEEWVTKYAKLCK